MPPPYTKCKTRIYLSAPVNPNRELVQEARALVQAEGVCIKQMSNRTATDGTVSASVMWRITNSDAVLMVTGWMFCPVCVQEYAYAKKQNKNILIQDLL